MKTIDNKHRNNCIISKGTIPNHNNNRNNNNLSTVLPKNKDK
jgi:hypothetical protein